MPKSHAVALVLILASLSPAFGYGEYSDEMIVTGFGNIRTRDGKTTIDGRSLDGCKDLKTPIAIKTNTPHEGDDVIALSEPTFVEPLPPQLTQAKLQLELFQIYIKGEPTEFLGARLGKSDGRGRLVPNSGVGFSFDYPVVDAQITGSDVFNVPGLFTYFQIGRPGKSPTRQMLLAKIEDKSLKRLELTTTLTLKGRAREVSFCLTSAKAVTSYDRDDL